MPTGTLTFHVAVIGPSDVQDELRSIEKVVSKLSRDFLSRGVTLSFHHWSYLAPGIGSPQNYIDDNLQWENMDFVIGAMWKKYGSPVEDADSGTEHECKKILELSSRGQPDLLFYFRNDPESESSPDVVKINEFRQALYKKALVGIYHNNEMFVDQVETAIRSKIEGKLQTQTQTQQRIGRLPINRNFSVEFIVFSDAKDVGQTPAIIILKDCHGKFFVIDTRYSTSQNIADWIAQTMGFAVTEGLTLYGQLVSMNEKNIKANNGILQHWCGSINYADYPAFKLRKLHIALGEYKVHDGKLGWDLSSGKTTINWRLKKPQIIVEPDGSKKLLL